MATASTMTIHPEETPMTVLSAESRILAALPTIENAEYLSEASCAYFDARTVWYRTTDVRPPSEGERDAWLAVVDAFDAFGRSCAKFQTDIEPLVVFG